MILGSMRSLSLLKDMGFKTFDKWWDESYDLKENTGDRIDGTSGTSGVDGSSGTSGVDGSSINNLKVVPLGTKAKIFKGRTGIKDACEYVQENKEKEFIDLWWRSERYTPDGIIDGAGLWDLVNQPVEKSDVNYPFGGLNDLTYGIRSGEMVTITAGSGLGKSQFLREIVYHIINNTQDNIGLLFLEESVKRTAKSLMSLHANKPLHLPDIEVTNEELRDSFDATLGTGRVYLFDHFGSTAIDNIITRVRFMAKALDCKYIFDTLRVNDTIYQIEYKPLEIIKQKHLIRWFR